MASMLIYVLPAVMDMILPAVFFMAQVMTAQRGESPSTVANFITVWAAVYMTSSFVLGRLVNRRNAPLLIMLSCVLTAGLSVAFSMTDSTRVMYVLMGMEGVGLALFFVPFQVFMKVVGENRQQSINRSVGLYTFSWSLGFAAGPFVAAVLWKYLGWQWSHLANAAAALFVLVMIVLLKHTAHAGGVESAGSQAAESPSPEPTRYERMPDLAWMGWLFSGLGCLAARMVYGLFPSSAETFELSRINQGLILFTLSAMQAFAGLILGRFHWWMYRPLPILATGACGFVGLLLFSSSRSAASFYIAGACFGVYSGTFFYYLVFHAIVHPARSSRYVAINETVVGLTSLLGPFIGGLIADGYTLRTSYLLTAGMLLAAVLVQAGVHTTFARAGTRAAVPVEV